MKTILFLSGYFLLTAASYAQQTLKPVDGASKIHFTIRNFGINTGGDFTGLKGSVNFDPKTPASAAIDVSVDASTIDTDNKTRDAHLKKEEYFNVEKFPTLHYKSTRISGTASGGYTAEGTITIKGTSKKISFPFTAMAREGGYQFECNFELNRRDFEVGGSSAVMSDNLKVTISVLAK